MMPTKIADVQPPTGFSRILWRLPIFFFRARIGWLLGNHFLLLNHTGRKTDLPRQTVLENIRHDKKTDTYFVVSGWGEKSDWYRNIQKSPDVTIQVVFRRLEVTAVRLPLEDAEGEILTYAHHHPRMLRSLARILGYQVEDTQEDYRALAGLMPVIALRPRNLFTGKDQ
jgi:deazaflavin-dependent oxidoreductase (nitroreductase family)